MINLEHEKRILFHKNSALEILEEEEDEKDEPSSPRERTLKDDEIDSFKQQEIERKEKLLSIIRREDRSNLDCEFLHDNLKGFSFMKRLFPMGAEEDINRDLLIAMYKKMKYELVPKGSTVYVQGEPSNDRMYIIITGEIGILEKEPDNKNRGTVDKAEFTRRLVRGNSLNQNKSALNLMLARFRHSPRGSLTPKRRGDRRGSVYDPNSDLRADELDAMLQNSKSPMAKAQAKMPSIQELSNEIKRTKSKSINSLKTIKSLSNLDQIEKPEPRKQGKQKREVDLGKNFNILSALSMAKMAFKSLPKRKMMLQRALIKYGTLKMIIQESSYFGEQILFSRIKRAQTALAMKNTDLLIIEKEDFKQIKYMVQEKHDLLKKFVKTAFPLLETYLSDRLLEKIMTSMNDFSYHKDQLILPEGKRGNYIYLVFEGEVEVSKGLIAYERDNQKINNIDARKKSRTTHKVLLAKLETGMMFGEEAIFYPNAPADFTIKCSSQKAIIYKINFHDFQEKFPEDVITAIFERYEDKLRKYFYSIKYALMSKFTEYEPIVADEYAHMSRIDKINLLQVQDIKHCLCMRKMINYQKIKNIDYLALLGHSNQQIEVDMIEEPRESLKTTKNAAIMLPHIQSARQLSNLLSDQLKSARSHANNNNKVDPLDQSKSNIEFDRFASHLSVHHKRKDTLASRVLDTSGLEETKPKLTYFNRITVSHHPDNDDSDSEKKDEIDESAINFSLAQKRHFLRPSATDHSGIYDMSGVDLFNHKRRDTLLSVRSLGHLAVSAHLDLNNSMNPSDLTKLIGKIPIPPQGEVLPSPRRVIETEPQEVIKKLDDRGEDTKRLGLIQHIRTLTHTHTHLYPLARVHKKVPSYSDDQAFTMAHGLVKRTWQEYQQMADSILPPKPSDDEYVSNLQNFKADFGFTDKRQEKNYKAAKIHIENFFHPLTHKNDKIGDQQSHLKGISKRINASLAKSEKKGFPSVLLSASVTPKNELMEEISGTLKSNFSKKRFGSIVSIENSPIPIENSIEFDSRDISGLVIGKKSDSGALRDDTFMTMVDQPSTEQNSNIGKNIGVKKTNFSEIIRHKKKINEMLKQKAKLQRPDLNLATTKYNPNKFVVVQGKSPFSYKP